MECQVEKKLHFRHLLLFHFNGQENASEAARNICKVYGEEAITERTAQKWFQKFREGIFNLDDAPRSGRPSDFDEETLNLLIHEDPRQSTRDLEQATGYDHATVARHLRQMGKVQKLGAWVPHALTDSQKCLRVSISASLLSRYQLATEHHRPFLSRIVTGDEKWCLYVNKKQKKAWVSPTKQPRPRAKSEIHQTKVMLSVWWDQSGVVHHELLPKNMTINAELYCQQLQRVKAAIEEKRPRLNNEVLLQHDNARPHVAKMTKSVIEELGWEILPHPPYSPDLAPTDFHLFRSLSNHLSGHIFESDAAISAFIDEFFDKKPKTFYRDGIRKLPERWSKIVEQSGEYLID